MLLLARAVIMVEVSGLLLAPLVPQQDALAALLPFVPVYCQGMLLLARAAMIVDLGGLLLAPLVP